ncbi:MAG TPA: hypothetical protein VMV07_11365 [Streptosporangiaceae bacterium]|nr:hypothetical protein [Streptosporangiaceae bacterium]
MIAVALASFLAGYAVGGSGKTTPAASGSPAPPSAASSPAAASPAQSAPAAVQKKTLARFSGSGIQNTARFTVPGSGDWELKWSYDCSSFGSQGNFQVGEDNGNDFNGANVNELGTGGHGITHVYGDAGRHYLSVDSECSWSMVAVSQP